MNNKIGILGGMGPEATVYLFDLIIKLTKVERDSDHIPVIIYSNPKIPDRTEAIIKNGPSPVPLLIEGVKFLERAKVDIIVMPCITAHHFYPEIIKGLKTPFLNLLDETVKYVENKKKDIKRLGLLATTGTVKTSLFQNHFERGNREIILPDRDDQLLLMDAIYGKEGIKAGYKEEPKKLIKEIVEHLVYERAQAIIAGCSEVPLVLKDDDISIPFIDPLRIITFQSILRMGYPLKF